MNRKQILLIVVILLITLSLTACGCEHEWMDATCLAPKTCSLCGETEGEITDHAWVDATCLAPKTCSVCNSTEGEALGHAWVDATCLVPKTCSLCQATEGDVAEHVWENDRRICTVCAFDDRPVDEKFMESLAAGLESRWVLTNADASKTEVLKSDWEGYFNAEYDHIKSYASLSFEDKNLEKWAKEYINSIGRSLEVLAYYGTNQWAQKYSNGVYHDRSVALFNIHKITPVPVSSENQSSLLGILSNGEAISMIRPLLDKVIFEKVEESYGWKTYQAVVENTTTVSFSYFSFDIDLIDKDGVTIATESAWVERWDAGEKIRFEFTTDEKFEEMNVAYANWNY